MHAGDRAVKIGDRGDQRGPGLGRFIGVGSIVAAWMKTESGIVMQSRNAAPAQIRFGDRARDWP